MRKSGWKTGKFQGMDNHVVQDSDCLILSTDTQHWEYHANIKNNGIEFSKEETVSTNKCYTTKHGYIYIYIYVRVCVCV